MPVLNTLQDDFPKMYMGFMRLVKKYDAPRLHSLFAAQLKAVWPSRLRDAQAAWDAERARDEAASVFVPWRRTRLPSHPDPGAYIETQCYIHLMTQCLYTAYALRMAVDYGIPSVLPHVFYSLAQRYMTGDYTASGKKCCGDLMALLPEEHCTLISGGSVLRNRIHSAFPLHAEGLDNICSDLTVGCSEDHDPDSEESRCNMRELLQILSIQMWEGRDPWTILDDTGLFHDHPVCAPCRDAVESHMLDYRETLWASLPEVFQLVSIGP